MSSYVMGNYLGEKLGNYRLTDVLGVGGFAEVYLGEHIYLKTQAAIKVLRVSLDDEALDQFLTEARTIAHLEHPNIVRILEFGVQGNTPYLVMNYAPNGTILSHYSRGSIVPLHMIMQYVRQVADALQYAHAHELIHRDVKPENILLGRDGEILLSDFGLAVMSPGAQSRRPIDRVGTIAYTAPEQIVGKPSSASDQYALSVVVYEWLCGRLPFAGSEEEVAIQHLQVPPPPLRERAPSVPPAIERVVMKALAKDPSERFLSVLHFAQVLEQAYQPHKLVQLLRPDPNVRVVDVRNTSLEDDAFEIAEPSPTPQSPSVPDGNADDRIMSSTQHMPASQAASEPSTKIPRRISRRAILAGLAGLTAVSAVGAGALWSFRGLRSPASLSHAPASTVQTASTSQATPGTSQFPGMTTSPTAGTSTPPTTPGASGTTSTAGAKPASAVVYRPRATPTAMPTSQATPTANTTSTSSYAYNANTAPTPTPITAPIQAPTPTPIPTPIPQPQPTPPGQGRGRKVGQQNGQGQQGNQQQ